MAYETILPMKHSQDFYIKIKKHELQRKIMQKMAKF